MARVKRIEAGTQYFWPVKHGGTAISDGALLMPGVTAETDDGVLIVASGAGADVVGSCIGAIATSESNTDVTDGNPWLLWPVSPCFPGIIMEMEYDQSDTAAVASYSAPTVTISSIEDNIDTGWIYVVGGTGAGQLGFIDTANGSVVTVETNFTTALDSTSTVIKILPLFHQLAKLNTAADKIGTDAAVGSWTCLILQNWIATLDRGAQVLRPDTGYHQNLQNLNATGRGTRFYADVCARNAGQQTTD